MDVLCENLYLCEEYSELCVCVCVCLSSFLTYLKLEPCLGSQIIATRKPVPTANCCCHRYTNTSDVFLRWRFGSVGNVVGCINEVNQRRAPLVLGWVTVFKTGKSSLYVTSRPDQLTLAIPPRVGKMSTGDDYGHRQGRNGEFCVTVGPVTRTAGILTQSVIWRTWAVC